MNNDDQNACETGIPRTRELLLPGFGGVCGEADSTWPAAGVSVPVDPSGQSYGNPALEPNGTAPVWRLGRFAFWAANAVLAGISLAAALRLIKPRTVIREVEIVRETQAEPDGIPLTLLPDTADPDLWETVSNMSGAIDGVCLEFKRGIATANGTVYRVLLDFCRNGKSIFAKVEGAKRHVVELDGQGHILKAYPAPKNDKPLKGIFSN